MSQATTNNEQLLQNCRTQRTQLLMLTSGHAYARALRSPKGQAASRALVIILKIKKRPRNTHWRLITLRSRKLVLGVSFFLCAICEAHSPRTCRWEGKRSRAAYSQQQTANSQQPEIEVRRWLRLLSTFSLLVSVCFRQASAIDLEFLLHRNPEILLHPMIEYLSRCEVAVNLSRLPLISAFVNFFNICFREASSTCLIYYLL